MWVALNAGLRKAGPTWRAQRQDGDFGLGFWAAMNRANMLALTALESVNSSFFTLFFHLKITQNLYY